MALAAAAAVLLLLRVVGMAVAPFLNNVATVLIVAPIAAAVAKDLGANPDAYLMAVAVGAGCDFLTPIGHQCNTLVMGPAAIGDRGDGGDAADRHGVDVGPVCGSLYMGCRCRLWPPPPVVWP